MPSLRSSATNRRASLGVSPASPAAAGSRSQEARVFRERLQLLHGLVATVDGLARKIKMLEGGVVSKLGFKLVAAQARRRPSP